MNNAYGGESLKPGYQGRGMIVYEPLSVLSLRQRLGRLRFACYQFGAALLTGLLIALFLLLSVELLPQWVGWSVVAVTSVALLVYQIGLLVRRLHDMEKSGWWVILAFVPLVNLPFQLYLYLGDGSSMVNRFGTPNPPVSAVVMLVGGLCWFINVLVLLSMMVLLVLGWFLPDLLAPYLGHLPQGWAEPVQQGLNAR